jgi:hypothetical protein
MLTEKSAGSFASGRPTDPTASGKSLLWVIRVIMTTRRSLPVFTLSTDIARRTQLVRFVPRTEMSSGENHSAHIRSGLPHSDVVIGTINKCHP